MECAQSAFDMIKKQDVTNTKTLHRRNQYGLATSMANCAELAHEHGHQDTHFDRDNDRNVLAHQLD